MNFVFFFPDEMSASSVSCYGNRSVRMPNYDRLAAEGTRFDQCIVQNPVCSPSRCSVMTGWYVHSLGHRSLWHLLRPHEPSLFRYLKNAGYDIRWYGKNDLYSQPYLDEICDDIPEKRDGYKTKPARRHAPVHGFKNKYTLKDAEYYSFLHEPMEDEEDEVPLDVEIARALDFLKNWKEGDKPFMLFLPIVMPHPPYNAPERYHRMYDPAAVGGDLIRFGDVSGKPAYYDLIRKYRRLDELPESFFDKIYATYLGMNSYVDYLLGELMAVMDERGLFDNTTLIASSDHGDYAGHYGLVEKWPNAMEDHLVRVPLLVKAPGKAAGHTVGEQVELFDVMPTVMELAAIEPVHAHFARSLVPQLGGAAGDPERLAFAEGGYDAQDVRCFEYHPRLGGLLDKENIYYPKVIQQKEHPESVCRTTMTRSLKRKLIVRTSGENELYDLERDPGELRNVYSDSRYAADRQYLEAALLRWYVSTADVVPRDDDQRGFNPNKPF